MFLHREKSTTGIQGNVGDTLPLEGWLSQDWNLMPALPLVAWLWNILSVSRCQPICLGAAVVVNYEEWEGEE